MIGRCEDELQRYARHIAAQEMQAPATMVVTAIVAAVTSFPE